MEGHCWTGQRPQWAVVPMEEEEEEEVEDVCQKNTTSAHARQEEGTVLVKRGR